MKGLLSALKDIFTWAVIGAGVGALVWAVGPLIFPTAAIGTFNTLALSGALLGAGLGVGAVAIKSSGQGGSQGTQNSQAQQDPTTGGPTTDNPNPKLGMKPDDSLDEKIAQQEKEIKDLTKESVSLDDELEKIEQEPDVKKTPGEEIDLEDGNMPIVDNDGFKTLGGDPIDKEKGQEINKNSDGKNSSTKEENPNPPNGDSIDKEEFPMPISGFETLGGEKKFNGTNLNDGTSTGEVEKPNGTTSDAEEPEIKGLLPAYVENSKEEENKELNGTTPDAKKIAKELSEIPKVKEEKDKIKISPSKFMDIETGYYNFRINNEDLTFIYNEKKQEVSLGKRNVQGNYTLIEDPEKTYNFSFSDSAFKKDLKEQNPDIFKKGMKAPNTYAEIREYLEKTGKLSEEEKKRLQQAKNKIKGNRP